MSPDVKTNLSFQKDSFFRDWNLHPNVLVALKDSDFQSPTWCQARVIPLLSKQKNVVCQYPTGSGKTDSYLIPLINQIALKTTASKGLKYLIIVPTWELGQQIYRRCQFFEKYVTSLKTSFWSRQTQVNFETKKVSPTNVVIATIGKLNKVMEANSALITKTTHLILDEFDFLLDHSFRDQLIKNCQKLNNLQCIAAFSATMNQTILQLCRKIIPNFTLITATKKDQQKNINHWVYYQTQKNDLAIIHQLINEIKPYFCLIFANSASQCRQIFHSLQKKQIQVALLDAAFKTSQRKQLLDNIHRGRYRYVVCTDLVARGLDFQNISDVISVHLPYDWEYYIHRAGRTGRLNNDGNSYLIINEKEASLLPKFNQYGIYFQTYNKKERSPTTKKKNQLFQNPQLQRKIQVIVAKSERKNVKPGYKKRRAKVINRLKKRHFFRDLDQKKRKGQKANDDN